MLKRSEYDHREAATRLEFIVKQVSEEKQELFALQGELGLNGSMTDSEF